jgi:hypothetical protein
MGPLTNITPTPDLLHSLRLLDSGILSGIIDITTKYGGMDTKNIDTLISEADKMIHTASEEMMRAEEDVTAHMVCINARQSILNYLISYLQKNGEELKQPVTMAGLLEQCRSIDGRFELVDLTPINCRNKTEHSDYCLDVGTVGACLKIAKQIRAIALADHPGY